MENKESLLYQFKSCLIDFWGETPTKTSIKQAWRDFLDTVSESENVPKEYYKLTRSELADLYREAGL